MDNQSIIGEFLNDSVAVEEWDKVYRKVDGTLHDPIDRYDLKLFLFNILSCLIGLPANTFVFFLRLAAKDSATSSYSVASFLAFLFFFLISSLSFITSHTANICADSTSPFTLCRTLIFCTIFYGR